MHKYVRRVVVAAASPFMFSWLDVNTRESRREIHAALLSSRRLELMLRVYDERVLVYTRRARLIVSRPLPPPSEFVRFSERNVDDVRRRIEGISLEDNHLVPDS